MNLENMNYKFASFLLSTGLPQCFVGKESTCNAGDTGDMGSVPGSGRSAGGGHGSSVQYFGLENPMARGVWWASVQMVTKSQTQLSGYYKDVRVFQGNNVI